MGLLRSLSCGHAQQQPAPCGLQQRGSSFVKSNARWLELDTSYPT
jgi:hypothetical protein